MSKFQDICVSCQEVIPVATCAWHMAEPNQVKKLVRSTHIDHGIGVVIRETAIVGDYAMIYQGVTLGGTGKETGKRHPILRGDIVVGSKGLDCQRVSHDGGLNWVIESMLC